MNILLFGKDNEGSEFEQICTAICTVEDEYPR